MKQVLFPDGTPTSQIGFGCANLMAGPGLESARCLVRAALDAGIRHFDTAPAYGSGTSEDALAAALEGRDEGVTITTKLGIVRPIAAKASAGLMARQLARTALAFAPGLKARLGQRAYQMSRQTNFAINALELSLAESLRRLRRERIDVLLLHEPEPEDVTDELRRWMENAVAQGRVGSIGFGAKRHSVLQLLQRWPGAQFVQTEWSPADASPEKADPLRFRSFHGALRHRAELSARIQHDVELQERLTAIGVDHNSPAGLAKAALALALADNPDGLLLISTAQPDRIGSAVQAVRLG